MCDEDKEEDGEGEREREDVDGWWCTLWSVMGWGRWAGLDQV
jgi:hypothetical protein